MALTDDARVFDPGLQLERTSLAWQRGVIALGVAVLALSRSVDRVFGWVGLWSAAAAIVIVLVLGIVVRSRYRASHRTLLAVSRLAHDGGAIAAAAAIAVFVGIVALILTVVIRLFGH